MADYGTAEGVAAIQVRHTNEGTFDTTTKPTLATVDSWLEQVSSALNAILSKNGYTVPLDALDTNKPMVDAFANEAVAELVAMVNGRGRFAASGESADRSPWSVLLEQVSEFIESIAPASPANLVTVKTMTRSDWVTE